MYYSTLLRIQTWNSKVILPESARESRRSFEIRDGALFEDVTTFFRFRSVSSCCARRIPSRRRHSRTHGNFKNFAVVTRIHILKPLSFLQMQFVHKQLVHSGRSSAVIKIESSDVLTDSRTPRFHWVEYKNKRTHTVQWLTDKKAQTKRTSYFSYFIVCNRDKKKWAAHYRFCILLFRQVACETLQSDFWRK